GRADAGSAGSSAVGWAGSTGGSLPGGAAGGSEAGSEAGSTAGSSANDAAASPSASAEAGAAAAAAAGGLISALGGALGGEVHHEPVDFNTLKAMLPASLPMMHRTEAEGSSQQALGVKSSSATAEYAGASSGSVNPHVHIKISDLSGVSGLLDAASGL